MWWNYSLQQQTNCSSFYDSDASRAYSPTQPLYYRFSLIVLPVVLSLFTIVGNGFVIIAIRVNKRLARKRTSILILNLALADMLVGGGVMPFGISQILTENHWTFGRTLCRVWAALDVICCTASIFTLCIISVDRFVGVTRPLSYSCIVTRGRLWASVVTVWILSIAVLLTTMQWNEETCSDVFVCRVGDELQYVPHSVVMSFFIPLTVILIVHYKIYQVTRRREMSLLHGSTECKGAATNNALVRNDDVLDSPIVGQQQKRSTASYYYEKFYSVAKSRRNARAATIDDEEAGGCGDGEGDGGYAEETRPINLADHRLDDEPIGNTPTTTPTMTRKHERKFSLKAALKRTTLRVHYGGHNDDVIKQRRFYSKHKKTAKTLALVVGAFLFCWLPFFVLYLISSTCDNVCVPPEAMEAFTWLGYTNSALNPIIYAVSMKTIGGGVRTTLARIASLCFYNPQGSRFSKRSRYSTSISLAPTTAVMTECSLDEDGTPTVHAAPFGRQRSNTSWTVVARASIWARKRATSLGSSLRPGGGASPGRKSFLGKASKNRGGGGAAAEVRRATVIANGSTTGSSTNGLICHSRLPLDIPRPGGTGELEKPITIAPRYEPPNLEKDESKNDLIFYNFCRKCEDDAELDANVGIAEVY